MRAVGLWLSPGMAGGPRGSPCGAGKGPGYRVKAGEGRRPGFMSTSSETGGPSCRGSGPPAPRPARHSSQGGLGSQEASCPFHGGTARRAAVPLPGFMPAQLTVRPHGNHRPGFAGQVAGAAHQGEGRGTIHFPQGLDHGKPTGPQARPVPRSLSLPVCFSLCLRSRITRGGHWARPDRWEGEALLREEGTVAGSGCTAVDLQDRSLHGSGVDRLLRTAEADGAWGRGAGGWA